jgi:hypothetical protein
MGNKVVTNTYGAPEKHILIANDSYMVTLGAIIKATGVTAGSDGRKIVKAGTPLYGDIEKRDTGFTIAGAQGASPVCVLMHDVDVTAGDENGTIVIAGCVDLLKLEASVKTALTSSIKAALPRIIFVEGSAY